MQEDFMYLYLNKDFDLDFCVNNNILDLRKLGDDIHINNRIFIHIYKSFKKFLNKNKIKKILLPNRSKIFIKFMNIDFYIPIKNTRNILKELNIECDTMDRYNNKDYLQKNLDYLFSGLKQVNLITLNFKNLLNNFFIDNKNLKFDNLIINNIKNITILIENKLKINNIQLKNIDVFNILGSLKLVENIKIENTNNIEKILNNFDVRNIKLSNINENNLTLTGCEKIDIYNSNIKNLKLLDSEYSNLYKTNIENLFIKNNFRKTKKIITYIYGGHINNCYIERLKTVIIKNSFVNTGNILNNSEVTLRNCNFNKLEIKQSNCLSFLNKNNNIKNCELFINNINEIFMLFNIVEQSFNNLNINITKSNSVLLEFIEEFIIHSDIDKNPLLTIYNIFNNINFGDKTSVNIKYGEKNYYSVGGIKNSIKKFIVSLLNGINDKDKLKFNVIKWFFTYTNDKKWIEDNFKNEKEFEEVKKTQTYQVLNI